MKVISPEKLAVRYPNKYVALNVAALEARRIIEGMHKDEIQMAQSPYEVALVRAIAGEIPWAKLTEADIEALSRETYEESLTQRSFTRPQSQF